jgi:hypothetical protein
LRSDSDAHVDDGSPAKQVVGQVRKRFRVASVLAASGELDDRRGMIVTQRIVAQPLVIF